MALPLCLLSTVIIYQSNGFSYYSRHVVHAKKNSFVFVSVAAHASQKLDFMFCIGVACGTVQNTDR